jgi:hypothetical protein
MNSESGLQAYKKSIIENENAIFAAFIRVMPQEDRFISREVLEEERGWIEEEIKITEQRLSSLQAKLADYNKVIEMLPNPNNEERLLS